MGEDISSKSRVETLTAVMTEQKQEIGKPASMSSLSVCSARPIETNMSITGALFMPNGKLVLCGVRNILFVFSRDFSIKRELALSSSPWDIARVNADNVVISLPDEKRLQCVIIEPLEGLGKSIQLKRACWGLDVCDDIIYVCVHDKAGLSKVKMLTTSGEPLKSVGTDRLGRSVFVEPFFVRAGSKDSGVTSLFVTDFKTNTLICITDSNDVISQKKLTSSNGPSGLLLDETTDALVCGAKSDNIILVTNNKTVEKQSVCLKEDHGLTRPYCMGYRREDSTLVVGMLYTPYCMVYKLTESRDTDD